MNIKRQWTSQPRIRDTPAGNVLLLAGILFSGATQGKVLRMLSHLKVACFTDRTFYYHQKRYLQPAVVSVWETKQSVLLAQYKAAGTPFTIGGNGRADSPGHSANYSSYRIIDLTTNEFIRIQSVQVCNIHDICKVY